MKQINSSPINNNTLKHFLNCVDYTVSKKVFSIYKDEKAELLVTTPRPSDERLGSYYESENYISHTDSQKTVVDKLYQSVRNYTLKTKLKLINSLRPECKSILDIGAGTGDFLYICKNNGWKVTGVEPNIKAKEIGESKINAKIVNDIYNIKNEKYDVITMWHVLEHVSNLEEYVISLKKLLTKNGTLMIAVPNYRSYDANYYKEYWAAFDVPRHLWHFSRKSISLLFEQQHMKVVKVLPMYFDSFYVSLLSEKYKTGKSNFIKAFYIGLISNIKALNTKEYSSLIYIIKND